MRECRLARNSKSTTHLCSRTASAKYVSYFNSVTQFLHILEDFSLKSPFLPKQAIIPSLSQQWEGLRSRFGGLWSIPGEMESFSFFHLRQDVSDIFFQSSALTISLLLYRDGVGCDSSMAPRRGIFTREIIWLLLIWTPHFVSPYGKMLPCKLHVSKYKIHRSMVQHAGNTGAEPLPIVLSGFATSLVLTSESLGEVMSITSGRSFRNPREALLSFCPGDWQYSTLVAAPSAWDSKWGWWQQHSPKPSFSNCHKNEKSTFRLLGLGGCLWPWRTLVYPDWHKDSKLFYWVQDWVIHQILKRRYRGHAPFASSMSTQGDVFAGPIASSVSFPYSSSVVLSLSSAVPLYHVRGVKTRSFIL